MTLPRRRRTRPSTGRRGTSSASASCRCSRRSSRASCRRSCPASAPEQGEPFANVLARSRRADRPGAHELAAPALLRVLRGHRVGAGDPRRAAVGDDEPGRAPLARVAGARPSSSCASSTGCGSCSGCPTAGTATSRTPRRPRRSRRSSPRGTSRGANVVVCSEHAHSSVEKARADARAWSCARCRSTRSSRMRADVSTLDDVARGRRNGRHDVVRVGRSGARARRARACGGRVAARRRGVRRLVVDLRRGALVAGRRRARRLARRQPAQVAARCRWTARCSGRRGRRSSARRSRSCPSTCGRREDVYALSRVRAGARPPLPRR